MVFVPIFVDDGLFDDAYEAQRINQSIWCWRPLDGSQCAPEPRRRDDDERSTRRLYDDKYILVLVRVHLYIYIDRVAGWGTRARRPKTAALGIARSVKLS